MRAFVKYLTVAVGLVLLAVALGVLILITRADTALKAALERSISYIYQADTKIEKVRLTPLNRTIHVEGLAIANPAPFEGGTALRCERVTVNFDLRALISSTPKLEKVRLESTVLDLRYKLGKGTNLGHLAKNASQRIETNDPDAPKGVRSTLVIGQVDCDGAKVNLSASVIPKASIQLEIPAFSLTDVNADHPIPAPELAAIVIETFLKKSVSLKNLLKPLADSLGKDLEELDLPPPEQPSP